METYIKLNCWVTIAQILRLIPLVSLFIPSLRIITSDFYMVLFFMIWDSIDCSILKLAGLSDDLPLKWIVGDNGNIGDKLIGNQLNQSCNYWEYQKMDKITDMITYIVLLIYFYRQKRSTFFVTISTILLAFRIIGVYFFLKTKETKYLVMFPDFLREFWLIYLFFQDIMPNVSISYQVPIYFIAVFFKIWAERNLHTTTYYPFGEKK